MFAQYRVSFGATKQIHTELLSVTTLTTSQGSDTVTSIFKCDSANTIKSLRLLKMA